MIGTLAALLIVLGWTALMVWYSRHLAKETVRISEILDEAEEGEGTYEG